MRPRGASIYASRKALVILAEATTDAGFTMASLPVERLSSEADETTIGAAALRVLAACPVGVQAPARDEYAERLAPVWRAAGVRSWQALARNAVLCQVHEGPGRITVVPTRHGGMRGPDRGFHDLPEQAIEVQGNATALELGAAMREALRRCLGGWGPAAA
jgi:CDI immunity protein